MTFSIIHRVVFFACICSCRHNNNASAFTHPRGIVIQARGFLRHSLPFLHASSNGDDDGDKNDDGADPQSPSPDDGAMADADLDKQKLALESILSGSGDGDEISTDRATPVLTSARKQRLEREIELLRQLDPDHPDNNPEYSDLQNQELVMAQLWSLWYGERGPANEMKLREVEETLADPDRWQDAENSYLTLIREHCGGSGNDDDGGDDRIDLSNWVEPANRLATLYFIMGRYSESRKWCERILNAKPWHVGALSGVVMVCMKMGDKDGVLKYSLMGLPNYSVQMRGKRVEWVERNVKAAEANLRRLEEVNRKAYRETDESSRSRISIEDVSVALEDEGGDNDSAWQ